MQDNYTHLGKTLLGLSLTGGGLGLVMNGSFTLDGGLLLRSLMSCLSSVSQFSRTRVTPPSKAAGHGKTE